MSNHISFELSASNQFLSDLFEEALDEAVSSEPMEVNSVEIILRRIGEAQLRPDHKSIHIYLPLHIQLKRPAGLFTVEGSGSINLHLVVDFDIDQSLKLKAKTDLVSHEWLEKPVLEIGALNIPVETLVNMVLKHHESIITAKIDASLKKVSDLHALLKEGLFLAKESLNSQDLKGNKFELNLKKVALVEPEVKDGKVYVKGRLESQLGINTAYIGETSQIEFEWIGEESMNQDASMQVDIELPYDLIKEELKESLQGMEVGGKHFDVRSMDISGGDKLHIGLEINDPIKAQIFVQGTPIYNEIEGLLIMNDLDVKVNPANFIYKLTAPLVNKFIENKMSEFFPLEVNQKLGEVVESKIPASINIPNGSIAIKHKKVSIEQLDFATDRLKGKALISNLAIAVTKS
ncbi:MAG: DUF4403 family protein [Saprospiraceae bacterium]|nr:DUF4403 family protein [Saprospiraceae bacterium]